MSIYLIIILIGTAFNLGFYLGARWARDIRRNIPIKRNRSTTINMQEFMKHKKQLDTEKPQGFGKKRFYGED